MEANAGALRRSPRPGASQPQPRAVVQTASSVTGFVLNTSAWSRTHKETTEPLPPCPTTSRPPDSLAAMGETGEALGSNNLQIQPMLDNMKPVSGEVVGVMTPAAAAGSDSQAPVGNVGPGRARDYLGEEVGKEREMSDGAHRGRVDESGARKKRKGKASEPLGSSTDRIINSSGSSIISAGGRGKDASSTSRPRSAIDDEDIDIGEEGEGGAGGGGGGGDADATGQDDTQHEHTPAKGLQQEQQQPPVSAEEGDAPTPGSDSSTRRRKRPESLPLPEQKAPRGNQYNLWSGAILRKVCQHRRIKGQQRVRDKDALALRLEEDDLRKGRLSPYIGDFKCSARGESRVC